MMRFHFLITILLLSSQILSGVCDDSMKNEVIEKGWHQEVKTGPLQDKINKLLPGETLFLSEGVHKGPIHIKTPGITVKGVPGTIISGQTIGSVIVIEASDVTIESVIVRESGLSYTQSDAGIGLRNSNGVKLLNNRIEDCLFGIDAYGGENLLIQGNKISSKNLEVGLRGDAIRLWSVHKVEVAKNFWSFSRDAVAWYSKKVIFKENTGSDSRYSIHCMYSHGLQIQNNNFKRNHVGIFIMYGNDYVITNNYIERSLGSTGIGIGLKESSNIMAQNNIINYSAVGILVDNSPFKRGSRNWFHGNKLAFNGKGIVLSNDLPGGEFKKNIFLANLEDVDTDQRKGSQSIWDKNYWDKYVGFDEDNNYVGDTPYIVKKYGDTLRGSNPKSSLFYGSPLLTLVTLIEEIANLGEPIHILTDQNPNIPKNTP